MSRVRHDLGGLGDSPASGKSGGGGEGGGGKPQTVKLAVAIGVLVIAGGLIAYQTGLFDSKPVPLAAQPGADADDNLNPDDPGQPPPKSNFSRRAQPLK